jgi:hypothetical protein
MIERATVLPGKPGNYPPKERAAYMLRVRKHAEALIELLVGTTFEGGGPVGDYISDDDLPEEVRRQLQSRGVDEEPDGRPETFWVDREGIRRTHYFYPWSAITDLLGEVVNWTYQDDYVSPGGTISSAPIQHARSASTNIIFFNCTLYQSLDQNAAAMPFSVLATIANVALQLPADECVDEDAARKQVRRFQARNPPRDNAFQGPYIEPNFVGPPNPSDLPF